MSTWSAGHDINDLPTDGRDPLAWTSPVEHLVRAVRDAPFPVIAAVEGGAWGAACNLAFACDLIVATRDATFAITPARMGVPYHTDGVAQFLGAVPLNVAKEMFLTAQPLAADSPHLAGTVNRLADDSASLEAGWRPLVDRIASLAPLSIRARRRVTRVATRSSKYRATPPLAARPSRGIQAGAASTSSGSRRAPMAR